jgi:hypothetical protein
MMGKISLISLILASLSFQAKAWTVMVMANSNAEWIDVDSQRQALRVGKFLNIGDTIISGAGNKIKLIDNHSVMVIGENSKVRIEEPERKSGMPEPVVMTLVQGKVRFTVDKTEAQKYRYQLPSIVAGVRGTEFVLTASPDKEVLCVLDGEVAAEIKATGAKATVKKNIGWIREGKEEGKLLPITPEQRKDWVKATTL